MQLKSVKAGTFFRTSELYEKFFNRQLGINAFQAVSDRTIECNYKRKVASTNIKKR